ncbi:MAG: hypothetical protein GVY08_02555 [Bacteroidetes bacterium]|jgi:hypothetical protein|nr:hypothetical protein [Bacteroidota bacterium]
MKHGLKVGLIGILLLLLAGFGVLTLRVDSIVKSGIEHHGREMTGTPVTVSDVSISLFSGQGSIRGLRVANPENYSREYAVEADEIFIEMDLYSLASDTVVVRELRLLSPKIYIEQKLPENNLHDIITHMGSLDSDREAEKGMVIEQFLLQNGEAELFTAVGGERSVLLDISAIEVNDLGRGGARQAILEIAERVADEIQRETMNNSWEKVKDAVEDLFN